MSHKVEPAEHGVPEAASLIVTSSARSLGTAAAKRSRLPSSSPTRQGNVAAPGTKPKMKPRTQLYSFFALIEVLAIGVFSLAANINSRAVLVAQRGEVVDSIGAVRQGVTAKIEECAYGVENATFDIEVLDFVAAQGNMSSAPLQRTLALVQSIMEVELLVLVNTTGHIMHEVNKPDGPLGALYDPAGVVTQAMQQPPFTLSSVYSFAVLPYAKLKEASPPLYRGRASDLDAAMIGASPYETREDSLIVWFAAPSFPWDGTYESLYTPTAYLVAGLIISGKSGTVSPVSEALGGTSALYANLGAAAPAADAAQQQWRTISTSTQLLLEGIARSTGKQVAVKALVPNFDPFAALHAQPILSSIAAGDNETVSQQQVDPYLLGARQWRSTAAKEVTVPGGPQLVVVRGLLNDEAHVAGHASSQWLLQLIVVLLDIATLWLATALYLTPLEQMGKRLKAGQSVDLSYLKRLSKRRYFSLVVAAAGLSSLGVSLKVALQQGAHLRSEVWRRSSLEPGVMALGYRKQTDAINRMNELWQAYSELPFLMQQPITDYYKAFMDSDLFYHQSGLQLEFALLIDSNETIRGSAGTHDFDGTTFDLVNIVNASVTNRVGYVRSGLVSAAALRNFNAPQYNQTLHDSTTVSHLTPLETGKEALIRWVSTPLKNGDDDIEAVLISGDVVNGNSLIVEAANEVIGRGYSAIYYTNSTGHYDLASSVLRLADDTMQQDIPLPSVAWLDKLRYSRAWLTEPASVSADMQLKGKRFIMSARCMPLNYKINADGVQDDTMSYNGIDELSDCPVFLIQGMPWSLVKKSLLPGVIMQYIYMAVAVIKLLALGYLCHRAYRPFRVIIVQNKFITNSNGAIFTSHPSPTSPEGTGKKPLFNHTSSRADTDRRSNGAAA